jgi:hypothetical protein
MTQSEAQTIEPGAPEPAVIVPLPEVPQWLRTSCRAAHLLLVLGLVAAEVAFGCYRVEAMDALGGWAIPVFGQVCLALLLLAVIEALRVLFALVRFGLRAGTLRALCRAAGTALVVLTVPMVLWWAEISPWRLHLRRNVAELDAILRSGVEHPRLLRDEHSAAFCFRWSTFGDSTYYLIHQPRELDAAARRWDGQSELSRMRLNRECWTHLEGPWYAFAD